MDNTNSEKVGTCLGILIMLGMLLASIYLGIYGFIYWWNNDSVSMMQVFKYILRTRPVIFWYIVISFFIYIFAQFKN